MLDKGPWAASHVILRVFLESSIPPALCYSKSHLLCLVLAFSTSVLLLLVGFGVVGLVGRISR